MSGSLFAVLNSRMSRFTKNPRIAACEIGMDANDVYGIGHALVDLQYPVDPVFLKDHGIAKGLMTLVDEDRQVELQAALAVSPANSASGGSAANTMIALARCGGHAHYAFRVGDDRWGDYYCRDLSEAGVGSGAASRGSGKTGQCMVFVTPDADRTMNTFLGASAGIGPRQVERQELRRSRYVYLEGYLLTSESGMEACDLARRWARSEGVGVSMTLSDPAIVQAFGERFHQLVDSGVDLLFCNEEEAMAFTGSGELHRAGSELAHRVPIAAITRGAGGALVVAGTTQEQVDAVPVQAVDTTGAGDSFAGGFLFGICRGYPIADAARLGCFAAAEVITKLGPRLERTLENEIESILAGTTPI